MSPTSLRSEEQTILHIDPEMCTQEVVEVVASLVINMKKVEGDIKIAIDFNECTSHGQYVLQRHLFLFWFYQAHWRTVLVVLSESFPGWGRVIDLLFVTFDTQDNNEADM